MAAALLPGTPQPPGDTKQHRTAIPMHAILRGEGEAGAGAARGCIMPPKLPGSTTPCDHMLSGDTELSHLHLAHSWECNAVLNAAVSVKFATNSICQPLFCMSHLHEMFVVCVSISLSHVTCCLPFHVIGEVV